MEQLTSKQVLDILVEAFTLLYREERWSKNCCATAQGQECPPWDLKADAWSSFGAIEKILVDGEEGMTHLSQVVCELERDVLDPLLPFDANHTHEEVLGLFYTAMKRISASLNLVMMTRETLLAADEEDDWAVMFFEQAALDAMDKAEEEHRQRFEEAYREEREAWQYARED